MPDLTPQDRAAFRRSLREAAYPVPAGDDLTTATRLLEAALHLRQNGERAPGGNETWAQLWRDIEAFLRSRLDRAASESRSPHRR